MANSLPTIIIKEGELVLPAFRESRDWESGANGDSFVSMIQATISGMGSVILLGVDLRGLESKRMAERRVRGRTMDQ